MANREPPLPHGLSQVFSQSIGGGEGEGGGEDVALVVVTHASSIAMNLWEGCGKNLWEECGGAFGARYGAMRRSCLSGWRLAVAPPRVPPPLLRFAPLSPLPLWSGVA